MGMVKAILVIMYFKICRILLIPGILDPELQLVHSYTSQVKVNSAFLLFSQSLLTKINCPGLARAVRNLAWVVN